MRDYIILKDDIGNIIVPADQVDQATNKNSIEKVKLAESYTIFSIDMNHGRYGIFKNSKNQFIVANENDQNRIVEKFDSLEDAKKYIFKH